MLRKRGNYNHYDFEIDGKRYHGSCKPYDKKLAEHIADTIKADILRNKHWTCYNSIDTKLRVY